MSLTVSIWLFTTAVTLHMVEEVIWLPAWSQGAGRWHAPVSRRAFAWATAVFLSILYLLAFLALQSTWAWLSQTAVSLLAALTLVMLLNLFLPHLLATIDQQRYAPGLASSLLFILPAGVFLLSRFFSETNLNWPRFLLSLVLVVPAAVWGWPALLRHFERL